MTDPLLSLLEAGALALERGAYADAIAAFRAAQTHRPLDASLALALANALRMGNRAAEAREVLTAFTASDADVSVEQCFDIGVALLETGAPTEAAGCFEAVVHERPRDPAAQSALAGALRAAGRATEAWPHAESAVTAGRTNAAFHLTAAQVRHELGDVDGALHWLDQAERLRPNHAPTQLQRAYTQLLKAGGASAAGWAAFESRSRPVPSTGARPWTGEPLEGASILVTAEQGVGDQFQFLRFVADLTARGASRVVVQCHADAVSLLVANGLDAVSRDAVPPGTDWHVPMLSLPHQLRLDRDVHGDRVPYLRAAPSALPTAHDTRRLGLVWSGNPNFVGRGTRDFDASLLPKLVDIPGITWLALQVGRAREAAPPSVVMLPEAQSWSDTAARLAALDGLVTTDTGIAHLAGAMGVRTWVMLQHVPDWRWGLTGTTTPWYPQTTLIRPRAWNDWESVVETLHVEIGRV